MNLNVEEILSLIEVLLDEKINDIPIKEGKRGVRGKPGIDGKDGKDGKDGRDFDFVENQKEILDLFLKNKDKFKGPKGDRGQKGQKGSPGKDGINGKNGKDGKDFDWNEYRDEIFNKIYEYRLKFSDLTKEEKEQLKGERGPRGLKGSQGRDGKDFIWEDHEQKIISEIEKNSLTFEKLTEDQKQELRGPRGLRGQKGKPGSDGKDGKDGKSFVWNEHEQEISSLVEKFRLKFEDLNNDQKEEIRGERGPRGQRGRQGIQGEKGDKGETGLAGIPGIAGLNGLDGKDGKDGLDGKDAPRIINITLEEWNNYIYFVFFFDDGTKIETKKIERPVVSQMVSQIIAGGGGGHRRYLSTNIQYDVNNRASVVRDYIDSDKNFLGRKEEIFYNNNFVDYIIESIYSAESNDENSPNKLIVEKKIDLIYTNNFVTDIRVIDVWVIENLQVLSLE